MFFVILVLTGALFQYGFLKPTNSAAAAYQGKQPRGASKIQGGKTEKKRAVREKFSTLSGGHTDQHNDKKSNENSEGLLNTERTTTQNRNNVIILEGDEMYDEVYPPALGEYRKGETIEVDGSAVYVPPPVKKKELPISRGHVLDLGNNEDDNDFVPRARKPVSRSADFIHTDMKTDLHKRLDDLNKDYGSLDITGDEEGEISMAPTGSNFVNDLLVNEVDGIPDNTDLFNPEKTLAVPVDLETTKRRRAYLQGGHQERLAPPTAFSVQGDFNDSVETASVQHEPAQETQLASGVIYDVSTVSDPIGRNTQYENLSATEIFQAADEHVKVTMSFGQLEKHRDVAQRSEYVRVDTSLENNLPVVGPGEMNKTGDIAKPDALPTVKLQALPYIDPIPPMIHDDTPSYMENGIQGPTIDISPGKIVNPI